MNGDAGETLDPDVAAEEARVGPHCYKNHAVDQHLRACKHFAHQTISNVKDICMLSSGKSRKLFVCKCHKKARCQHVHIVTAA